MSKQQAEHTTGPDLLTEASRDLEFMLELQDKHLSGAATVVRALLQKRIEATRAAIARARGTTP